MSGASDAGGVPMPDGDPYRLAAAFYRAAVSLGLASGAEVIRWADDVIVRDPAPPAALYDVSLAPADDTLAMYDALAPLAPLAAESTPLPVVRALLDILSRRVLARRLGIGEAVAVIHRASQALDVPEPLRWEMVALEDDHALAAEGVAGDLPAMESHVRTWLAQFDGAADALLAGAD